MENTNWLKQTDKPLFEDLLWSRPQNRRQAGKLLIVGGHAHSFLEPARAYSGVLEAGIGTAKVLLPDSTQKVVSGAFPEAEFSPSTPSGSFSRQSLAQLLELADWADGMLLAGDFGHNSETAILLESLIEKYKGQLTMANDSIDYFIDHPGSAISRPNSLLVADFSQLQKLSKNSRPNLNLQYSMDLHSLVTRLSEWTAEEPASFVTFHNNHILAARSGKVSTTASKRGINALASHAATWWIQQPAKTLEALTTAAWCYIQK